MFVFSPGTSRCEIRQNGHIWRIFVLSPDATRRKNTTSRGAKTRHGTNQPPYIYNTLTKSQFTKQFLFRFSAAHLLRPAETDYSGAYSRYLTKDYLINNYRKVGYFFVYWTLNIVLFAVAMWLYRDSNKWIMVILLGIQLG
jgi:hypothetical protein